MKRIANGIGRQILLLGGILLLTGLAMAKSHDVREFGAKGDGLSDDTAAFQRALDEARKAGGAVVGVPAGHYLIKTHLTIPDAVTLDGVWRGPASVPMLPQAPSATATAPTTGSLPGIELPNQSLGWQKKIVADPSLLLAGSVLLAVEGAGQPAATPFILLKNSASLKGMTVFYPDQKMTNPPVAYPWTVAGDGDNCSVIDVTLVNPYQALDFGTRPCSRHFVRNVNAQALYRGLFIDQCYDIGRVENVHFWPFWRTDLNCQACQFTKAKGEAYVIGRTDWEYISNSFSIAYQVGMRFVKSPGDPKAGAGNVLLTQSGSDMAPHALVIDDCQSHSGLAFLNSNLFGQINISPSNTGPVKFTNCCFFGTVMPAQEDDIVIDGANRVSFTNCHFIELDAGNKKSKRVIHAMGGRLGLANCQFMWTGERRQVVLDPGVKTAVIMGNDFEGKMRIDNRAKGQVQIGLNVMSDAPTTVIQPAAAPAGPGK